MPMRIPAERIRYPLAQAYYALRALSWVIGTGFIAILLFADPDHRLARAAGETFSVLFNAIVK